MLRLTQTALDQYDMTQDEILSRLRDNVLGVYLRFQLGATQRGAFESPEYVRFHTWSAMLYLKCRGLFRSRESRAYGNNVKKR